jgi:hypothetical protein
MRGFENAILHDPYHDLEHEEQLEHEAPSPARECRGAAVKFGKAREGI